MNVSVALFDEPRLDREFSPNAWARGRRYFQEGRVGPIQAAQPAPGWRAAVQGRAEEPYDVVLRVWDEARPRLSGACTCPATPPCKHLAALLWALRDTRPIASPLATSPDPRAAYTGEDLAALRAWSQALRTPDATPGSPPRSSKRLVFVLSVDRVYPGAPARLIVAARAAFALKKGGLGKSTPHDMRAAVSGYGEVAPYVTEADRILWFRLTRLQGSPRHATMDAPAICRSPQGAALFADLLATGRCYFGDTTGAPMTAGPPRTATLAWREDAGGRQRPALILQPSAPTDAPPPGADTLRLLPLSPLHYFDPGHGSAGPLTLLGIDDRVAESIVDIPVLEPETVAGIPEDLLRSLREAGLPLPAARTVQWLPEAPPQPKLRLTTDEERDAGPEGLDNIVAALSFGYGAVDVGYDAGAAMRGEAASAVDGETVLKVVRDHGAEAERLAQLAEHGLVPREPGTLGLPRADDWVAFVHGAVPQLAGQGWTIAIEPHFPIQAAEQGAWYLKLREDDAADGADWFSLALGVEIDGVPVNLLPAVVAAIRSGRVARSTAGADQPDVVLPVGQGRWVRVPGPRLAAIVDTLVELFDDRLHDGTLRVSAFDGARLMALPDFAWRGGQQLRTLAQQLSGREPVPKVPVPRGLHATLRDYQQTGLDWLGLLAAHGFGGVLADDMGLGKTVQALAHILAQREAGRDDRPSLVVAPRSVIGNWQRECERFAPQLRCAVFHGPHRAEILTEDPLPALVVTTYALLHRDEQLRTQSWQIVVLDEAQAIKNPKTAVAHAARSLRARQRLCLTGTPMENNLEDLWSLFAFATPGLLGSARAFARHYRGPIERHHDSRMMAALSARIAPFLLRRTKGQVLDELPPKTEVMLTIPLGTAQRDLYESVRLTMEKRVREALRAQGLARSQIVVLDALLKLRQVCCHPGLVKGRASAAEAIPSAKTDRLMELLLELHGEGRRAVVFSQFTSMLELIAARLDDHGLEYDRITGKTRRRQAVVDAFQAGAFSVLLVSLKAGGTGINLTAADVVVHYDPWWNPAVEAQATDRAHRIGQTRPITVYRLVCEGTVEQGVLALQTRKRALTGAVARGAEAHAAGGLRLADGEVEALLAPLGHGAV